VAHELLNWICIGVGLYYYQIIQTREKSAQPTKCAPIWATLPLELKPTAPSAPVPPRNGDFDTPLARSPVSPALAQRNSRSWQCEFKSWPVCWGCEGIAFVIPETAAAAATATCIAQQCQHPAALLLRNTTGRLLSASASASAGPGLLSTIYYFCNSSRNGDAQNGQPGPYQATSVATAGPQFSLAPPFRSPDLTCLVCLAKKLGMPGVEDPWHGARNHQPSRVGTCPATSPATS